MKAFYCCWPNYGYIDSLINSGIDTILLTVHDLPFEKESRYYDSLKTVENTISRYKGRCKFFLVPLWVRDPFYFDIPESQRWTMRDGRKLSKTPCPRNKEYIDSRVLPAIAFCKEHNLDGIIWDLEHLSPPQFKDEVIHFYLDKKPEQRCWCDLCRSLNTEDLWKAHAGLIKNHLDQSGIPIHGQMPYSYGWTMRQYPGQLYHFTEETYERDISCLEFARWSLSYKKYGVNPKIVPGIWCEFKKTEKELIHYIKKLYKKYGGFWLYSHEFFGNFIPNPHMNYPNPGPATDYFFEELAKI